MRGRWHVDLPLSIIYQGHSGYDFGMLKIKRKSSLIILGGVISLCGGCSSNASSPSAESLSYQQGWDNTIEGGTASTLSGGGPSPETACSMALGYASEFDNSAPEDSSEWAKGCVAALVALSNSSSIANDSPTTFPGNP